MKKLFPAFVPAMLLLISVSLAGCKKNDADAGNTDVNVQENTADESEPARDDFAGAWTDQNTGAMLDIWKSEDGVFHALVCIKTSETEVSYWSFTAPAEDGKLNYTDCERVDAVYGDLGQISETTVYERGRGSVEFSGDDLVWYDATDDAGAGLSFAYEGGY